VTGVQTCALPILVEGVQYEVVGVPRVAPVTTAHLEDPLLQRLAFGTSHRKVPPVSHRPMWPAIRVSTTEEPPLTRRAPDRARRQPSHHRRRVAPPAWPSRAPRLTPERRGPTGARGEPVRPGRADAGRSRPRRFARTTRSSDRGPQNRTLRRQRAQERPRDARSRAGAAARGARAHARRRVR